MAALMCTKKYYLLFYFQSSCDGSITNGKEGKAFHFCGRLQKALLLV